MRVSRGAAKVAALTVVVGTIGAGVAFAAIPGNDGVITACYAKSGGAVRVINAPSVKCRSTENQLAWNQQGPRGYRGFPGEDGTDGTNGVSGYEVVSKDVGVDDGFGGITKTYLESVRCPDGKVAIGGGGEGNLIDANSVLGPIDVSESHPSTSDAAVWQVGFSKLDGSYYNDGEGYDGTAYAVCITAATPPQ